MMKHALVNKSRWINSVLLFLAAPWFADLALFFNGTQSLTLAAFVEPTFDEILVSGLLLVLFLFSVRLFAVFCVRLSLIRRPIPPVVSDSVVGKVASFLLPIFCILNFVFLWTALKVGPINALLGFRFNTQEIGFLGYTLLLFFPIVLALAWRQNSLLANSLLLSLIAFTNLLTGYRILLINGLIFLLIYNNTYFLGIKNRTKILSAIFLFFVLLSYELFRSTLEFGGSEGVAYSSTIFDTLGRSFPIRYFAIIARNHVETDWSLSYRLFTEPIELIYAKVFSLPDQQSVTTLITEPIARSYLVWRGTPNAESTGFSIHILPNSFLLGGLLGIALYSIVLGIFLGLGLQSLESNSAINRLFGTVFLSFVIGCTESFNEAYRCLFYSIGFLILFVMLARLLHVFSLHRTHCASDS
jgi:hypothetical protein